MDVSKETLGALNIGELYTLLEATEITQDEWFTVNDEINRREEEDDEMSKVNIGVDDDYDTFVEGLDTGASAITGGYTEKYGSYGTGSYSASPPPRTRLIEGELDPLMKHVADLARGRRLYVLEGTFNPYYRGGSVPRWYPLEGQFIDAMQTLLDDDSLSIRDFSEGQPVLGKGLMLEVEPYRRPTYRTGVYTPAKGATTVKSTQTTPKSGAAGLSTS